jgi:hypothetical protein
MACRLVRGAAVHGAGLGWPRHAWWARQAESLIVAMVDAALKEDFVAQGLMLGEFHLANNSAGLRNSSFFPLRTPYPCLAIRHMVSSGHPPACQPGVWNSWLSDQGVREAVWGGSKLGLTERGGPRTPGADGHRVHDRLPRAEAHPLSHRVPRGAGGAARARGGGGGGGRAARGEHDGRARSTDKTARWLN